MPRGHPWPQLQHRDRRRLHRRSHRRDHDDLGDGPRPGLRDRHVQRRRDGLSVGSRDGRPARSHRTGQWRFDGPGPDRSGHADVLDHLHRYRRRAVAISCRGPRDMARERAGCSAPTVRTHDDGHGTLEIATSASGTSSNGTRARRRRVASSSWAQVSARPTLACRRRRPAGAYHDARPRTRIEAGRRMLRISVASMNTANARPNPSC